MAVGHECFFRGNFFFFLAHSTCDVSSIKAPLCLVGYLVHQMINIETTESSGAEGSTKDTQQAYFV